MPRRLKGKQVEPEVRQRILDAALKEFSHRGYDRAALDTIAERADVSKGAIYWYFANKAELFVAVWEQALSNYMEYLEGIAQADEQPLVDRMEAIFVAAVSYHKKHSDFYNLMKSSYSPDLQGCAGKIENLANKLIQRGREMAEAQLQEGVRRGEVMPERVAAATPMLVALLDGLIAQWLIAPKAVPLEKMARGIALILVNGIASKPR
ncbi:MAG: TetR family transcriptional regulator [Chloroflexi bacterium]|nr:TetR family transcriptional regulator [Chloroflexota bacterium]